MLPAKRLTLEPSFRHLAELSNGGWFESGVLNGGKGDQQQHEISYEEIFVGFGNDSTFLSDNKFFWIKSHQVPKQKSSLKVVGSTSYINGQLGS